MLTIREEQLRRMGEEAERATREKFASRLRAECPAELLPASGEEFDRQIEEGWRAARALNVSREEDVYRFLRLRYAEADRLASDAVRNAFYKIITDRELDATRRLDFVERHIFNRPPR